MENEAWNDRFENNLFPSCKFKGNFASCVINTSVPRSLDGGQLSTLGYYLWESPQAQEGRGLVMMMTIFNKNGDDNWFGDDDDDENDKIIFNKNGDDDGSGVIT